MKRNKDEPSDEAKAAYPFDGSGKSYDKQRAFDEGVLSRANLMMRFFVINPKQRYASLFEAHDPRDLVKALNIGLTDSGVLWPGFSIIVYEYGLLEPKHQDFFAINRCLFQGTAVCYSYQIRNGETISVREADVAKVLSNIQFFNDRLSVEEAIMRGDVERPVMTVNGVPQWHWNVRGDRENHPLKGERS